MKWFPDVSVAHVRDIPYEALYDAGYRVVLFDIDNTIVPHGAPADAEAIALFARIREAGLAAVLISNNTEERVKPFADTVGAQYLHKAGKPKASGFRRAMALAGGDRSNTFFVGDQIFTDVWGATAAGVDRVDGRGVERGHDVTSQPCARAASASAAQPQERRMSE